MSGELFRARSLAAILIFAFLQCLPAAYNGYPFIFFDTRGYHNAGEAVTNIAVSKIAGKSVRNAVDLSGAGGSTGDQAEADSPGEDGETVIPMARSPYYGTILYNLWQVGPFLFVAFQAFVVALVAWLVCRRICPEKPATACLSAGVVCLFLTPLPYFAGYGMPDVFTGLIPLAVFLLCYSPKALSWGEWIFLWVLLAAAALFHSSHILIGLGLFLLISALAISDRYRPRAAGWAGVGSAVAVGVAGVFLFAFVAYSVFGSWPVNPPFLTARGIEDGPVSQMVAEGCDEEKFAICGAESFASLDSQQFLWNMDSFYNRSDAATKTRLSQQDAAVFLTAASRWPGLQLSASAGNFADQLAMFGLNEFDTAARVFRESAPGYMAQDDLRAYGASRAVNGDFPFDTLSVAIYLSAMFGLAIVTFLVFRPDSDRHVRALAILVLATIIGNALINGVLSDPHHRYQARVIWLLPFLATLLIVRFRSSPRKTAG